MPARSHRARSFRWRCPARSATCRSGSPIRSGRSACRGGGSPGCCRGCCISARRARVNGPLRAPARCVRSMVLRSSRIRSFSHRPVRRTSCAMTACCTSTAPNAHSLPPRSHASYGPTMPVRWRSWMLRAFTTSSPRSLPSIGSDSSCATTDTCEAHCASCRRWQTTSRETAARSCVRQSRASE